MKQVIFCPERILNFAAMRLQYAEECARLSVRLNYAKYYSQTVGGTLIVFNIRYEDAKQFAKEHGQLPFMFGVNLNNTISISYWKWGLLLKHNGRLRRGYYPAEHCSIDKTCAERSDDACSFGLSTVGLTFDALLDAADSMQQKLECRQRQIKWSDSDITSAIRQSLNDLYYAKGRYYARATLYQK